MSEFIGPDIIKKRGGLGRTSPENKDSIRGLVGGAVAVASTFVLGTIYKLIQLSDAEDLGLNAAYDSTNKILFYTHIKNFFEYAPDGTLYIMGVAQATTLANMCDKSLAFVYKMATDESTNREITRIGVVRNPATGYTPTYTTGLDADVLAAIANVEDLGEDLLARHIRFDGVYIEGRLGPAATISTLPSMRALSAEYASVIIGQDPAVVSLDALFARYGDVGSALGMNAVRKVSECLGSADIVNKPDSKLGDETYPLTNVAKGLYLSAQISTGKKFSDLTVAEQTALETKGYIYIGKYEGLDGFFFNDSHNCIVVTDDYAYNEDNQVFNKAAFLVRKALLPLMKGQVETDPSTGFIPASVCAFYESKAQKALNPMVANDELSGKPLIKLLPNQDVVGTGLIEMSVQYYRQGILRKFRVNVGAINAAVSA